MKINPICGVRQSFKSARINIVANSDNHGNITTLPEFYNTIRENRDEIFQKSNEDSTLNLYINVGDFFINGAKQGFRSDDKLTNMDVQKDFLELLIRKIKKVANTEQFEKEVKDRKNRGLTTDNYSVRKPVRFEALYTPGNHCFDAGDKALYQALDSIDGLTTVMTNIDVKKSEAYQKYGFDKENSHFVTSKEFEIPDDKNSEKKHHLMVLGATIPAMGFYNPGLLEETTFADENSIKDSDMQKENIKNTIKQIREKSIEFKKKYNDGIIILSSHLGTRLSKVIRDEVPYIDEILDGHKHDVATFKKGKCNVSSLGQDNKTIKAISLQIDDFGDIEREDYVYTTSQYQDDEINALKRKLGIGGSHVKKTDSYSMEFEPIIQIYDNNNSANVHDFAYRETVRYSHSMLANFLTTSLKESINKIDKDVDVVGVQSSIIRGGIQDGSTNFDLMKVFDGVSEKLSTVKTGSVTGEELFFVVLENLRENLANKKRNTIIQWSDIRVNRAEIEKTFKEIEDDLCSNDDINNNIPFRNKLKQIITSKNPEDIKTKEKIMDIFKDDILIRTGDGEYKPIDFSKTYKIAIADKYLSKTDIVMPQVIHDKFEIKTMAGCDSNGNEVQVPITYHRLFMDYLNDSKRRTKPDTAYDFPHHGSDLVIDYTDKNNHINRIYVNPNCMERRIID